MKIHCWLRGKFHRWVFVGSIKGGTVLKERCRECGSVNWLECA